jgi:hypothetical protein
VSDTQHRPAENLAAERARVNDRADVGDGEVVGDAVLAGLEIDFDFGEAGDEGVRPPSRFMVSRAVATRP